MNVSWIVSVIIFALVAAFLIGVFLCWTGSAYRKKIYYICVTLWEAAILIGYCIDSMTDEDGYYRRIAGKEAFILAVLIVLMVCILISYLKNRKLSSVFHILTLMWINVILCDGLFLNFCSSIFLPLFIIAAILTGVIVYRTDQLAEVLPGAFLGGNIFGFIAFIIYGTNANNVSVKVNETGGVKSVLILAGMEFIFTAAGCLIQFMVVKKRKKQSIFNK